MELFNMSVLISIVQLFETVQYVPVLCNICQYCLFLPELNACFCCLNACCCFSAASTTDSHCPTTLLIRNKYSFIEHSSALGARSREASTCSTSLFLVLGIVEQCTSDCNCQQTTATLLAWWEAGMPILQRLELLWSQSAAKSWLKLGVILPWS